MGLKFRQRSGLGDLSRRDHSFIQRLIIEHTPCASHCAGCWATRSLPHGTPGDFIKAAANAMAPDETDEIAHGVCAHVCTARDGHEAPGVRGGQRRRPWGTGLSRGTQPQQQNHEAQRFKN